jgi:hypothetical protein
VQPNLLAAEEMIDCQYCCLFRFSILVGFGLGCGQATAAKMVEDMRFFVSEEDKRQLEQKLKELELAQCASKHEAASACARVGLLEADNLKLMQSNQKLACKCQVEAEGT